MATQGLLAGLYTFQGAEVNSISALEHLRQWELAAESGPDADLGQDAIVIKTPGTYFVHASLSFRGTAGVTYYAELRVNDARVQGGLLAAQHVPTTGEPFNMTVVGAGLLNEGDIVSVYVGSDEAGGANFQMLYGQFGLFKV